MKSISQQPQNHILTWLDQGKSWKKIALEFGIHYSDAIRLCPQHCSTIPKAQGGRPSKPNSPGTCHAIHIISTRRADTAVQVEESLQDTLPEPVSSQKVWGALKNTGLKAVVKAKICALSKKPPALDCGGQEEGYLVRWDQNQLFGIIWEEVGVEDEGGGPLWQVGAGDTQIWRWACDAVGLLWVVWGRTHPQNWWYYWFQPLCEDGLQKSLNYWDKMPREWVITSSISIKLVERPWC